MSLVCKQKYLLVAMQADRKAGRGALCAIVHHTLASATTMGLFCSWSSSSSIKPCGIRTTTVGSTATTETMDSAALRMASSPANCPAQTWRRMWTTQCLAWVCGLAQPRSGVSAGRDSRATHLQKAFLLHLAWLPFEHGLETAAQHKEEIGPPFALQCR